MRLIRHGAAGAAAAFLIAQPCAAADDFRATGATDVRMTAFAGMHVRLPLGGAVRPTARLQFTTGYRISDTSSSASRTFLGEGFEIGLGKKGAPTYFAAELHRWLGMSGTGKTLLIVGGVLVVAVVVGVAAGGAGFGDTCPTVGGDRSHCTNP
jgi:hypothetical protein